MISKIYKKNLNNDLEKKLILLLIFNFDLVTSYSILLYPITAVQFEVFVIR